MTLQWSDYAIKTFQEASDYIACNFYPDYADAFDADVLETVEKLLDSPFLGKEAYPMTFAKFSAETKTGGVTIASLMKP